jgi:hypothetical protein
MCVKEEIDNEIKDFNSTLSPDTEACEDTSCKVNLCNAVEGFCPLYVTRALRAPVLILINIGNRVLHDIPQNTAALCFYLYLTLCKLVPGNQTWYLYFHAAGVYSTTGPLNASI